MYFIIRWRGFASFEGLGLSILSVVIGADFFAMIITSYMNSDNMFQVFGLRIVPGIIHIIGQVALAMGLFVAEPNPKKISFELSDRDKKKIIQIAWFLVIFGFSMKVFSIYSAGYTSFQSYFLNIYSYVVTQGKYGGFWGEGLSIMILGLALIAAQSNTIKSQSVFLFIMSVVLFALSASRSGIILIFLYFFVLLFIFNKKIVKRWINPLIIIPLSILIIISAGIKSQLRADASQLDLSFSQMWRWGVDRFLDRFGEKGLYDGYTIFINRLQKDETRYRNGDVINYTLTSWIPYVFYKNKPIHPFRAIGDLVYRDYTINEKDVSAVTLIGTAFFDYGIFSVMIYIFAYGFLLGFVRKITTNREKNMFLIVWYLHFMIIDGCTNIIHGGITNIVGTLAFATAVVTISFIFFQMLQFFQSAAEYNLYIRLKYIKPI